MVETLEFGRSGNERGRWQAMKRGFLCRCPNCGEGRLFSSFTKSVDACTVCGEQIHHHRADDFPAYLVILLVGHILAPAFLATHLVVELPTWANFAIWLPLVLILSLALLQPVKGAVISLQWALRMHGFGAGEPALDDADNHNSERY